MAGTATIGLAGPRAGRRLAGAILLGVVAAVAVVAVPVVVDISSRAKTSTPTTAPAPATARVETVSDTPTPVSTTDATALVRFHETSSTSTETTSTTSTTSVLPEDVETQLDIDEVFGPIHDQLAREVTVPIRLPLDVGEGTEPWSPTVGSIDPGGYVIHLGISDDCNGASECRVSTFTARRSLRTNPTVTATGTPVPLPGGLDGVFSDSSCGADCNNGFITWVEGDVLYSVGSRLGSGPEVLALAWSAVDPTQRPPEPPEVCGPGAPADSGRVARSLSTELADGRSMHWIVACSIDGTIVEVLHEPGDLRWLDIDNDDLRDAIVRTQDGRTTIFAMGGNTPRAAIDIATSGRLVVEDLGCADLDSDGNAEAIDRASGDRLRFISPILVRRSPLTDVDLDTVGDC